MAGVDEVADVSERQELQEAAVGLRRCEHACGIDALTAVAVATAAQAKLRFDAAGALARTPAPAGPTSAMTRQSAQERWRYIGRPRAGDGT